MPKCSRCDYVECDFCGYGIKPDEEEECGRCGKYACPDCREAHARSHEEEYGDAV